MPLKQHSVICILIVMLLVLAIKDNLRMNIGIKYTIELNLFTSMLFMKTQGQCCVQDPKQAHPKRKIAKQARFQD